MIYRLLSHAGEHHETAAEAAKHASESTVTLSSSLLFWVVLLLGPIIIWAILSAIKIKIPVKLLAVSTFLIIFSIISYQNPGIYSAVALSLGFAIVLLQTLLSLSGDKQ